MLETIILYYCWGALHYASGIHYVAYKRPVELSRHDCSNLVYSKKFPYHGHIHDIQHPEYHITVDDLYGTDSFSAGTCYGEDFADPTTGYLYKKAIVKSLLDIYVTETSGIYRKDSNEVILENLAFPMKDYYGRSHGATYLWEIVEDNCNNRYMQVLYKPATKYTPNDDEESPVLIIDDPEAGQALGLVLLGTEDRCGIRTYLTQLENIHVVLGDSPMNAKDFSPQHFDKFFSMEASIHHSVITTGMSIRDTFETLVKEMCESKKAALKNALATIQSSNLMTVEVAGFEFKGHKVVRTGRSAMILKCEEVVTTYRPTEECWNDIPVTYNNESLFVDSLNEIIKENSSRAFCSKLYPLQYRIGSEWYCSDPDLRPCGKKEIPTLLKPRLTKVENYTVQLRFETLRSKGYSREQCRAHSEWEKFSDAVQATLVAIGAGKQSDDGYSSFGKGLGDLFPRETLEGLSAVFSQDVMGLISLWIGNPFKQLQEWEGAINILGMFFGGLASVYATYRDHGWCVRMVLSLFLPAIFLILNPIWMGLYFMTLHEICSHGVCPHLREMERQRKERERGKGKSKSLFGYLRRAFCGRPNKKAADDEQEEDLYGFSGFGRNEFDRNDDPSPSAPAPNQDPNPRYVAGPSYFQGYPTDPLPRRNYETTNPKTVRFAEMPAAGRPLLPRSEAEPYENIEHIYETPRSHTDTIV